MTGQAIAAVPMLIVVMGVSGTGKSTVGAALAERLNIRFVEADTFHGVAARERMASGRPLSDALREPWVSAICAALHCLKAMEASCVLACSALRAVHRERFRQLGFATRFLHLHAPRPVLAARLAARRDHFMPASLLPSQITTLQSPLAEPDVTLIDASQSVADVLRNCRRSVQSEACR